MHETLSRPPILGSAWPVLWYATAGHHPYDADDHRAGASWYKAKAEPSTADMIVKFKRVIIAAR